MVCKMKKLFIAIVTLALIFSCVPAASAATNGEVIYHSQYCLDNDITIVDEIISYSQARSSDKTYEFNRQITASGTTIGSISIKGTFRYDGSTVSVVSKSVTKTDTYNGWKYSQSSFTSSGGTITLSAKLTKTLTPSIPFTMTLSCDKDGNISHS